MRSRSSSRPLRGSAWLAGGQGLLDLGPGFGGGRGGPLPITSSRLGHLLDGLARGYDVLGFGRAAGGDEVFRDLVLARIIEPVSKLDSLRVLEEAGVAPVSYAALKRRLPGYAKDSWRAASSRPRARYTRAWARPAWCSMTSRRSRAERC